MAPSRADLIKENRLLRGQVARLKVDLQHVRNTSGWDTMFQRENRELRRRQTWLEQRVADLEAILAQVDEIDERPCPPAKTMPALSL